MALKSRFAKNIIMMSVLPVVFLCIIMSITTSYRDRNEKVNQIWTNLRQTTETLGMMYRMQVSDWENILDLDAAADIDYSFLNVISAIAECDVTIFAGDVRIATTVLNAYNERAVGTTASEEVVRTVLQEGKNYQKTHQEIAGKDYYAYYIPLRNSQGIIIGMLFAGKTAKQVNASLGGSLIGNLIYILLLSVVTGWISYMYSRQAATDIGSIITYMDQVTKSDFSHEMDENVLKRKDEIGQLGEYTVRMSTSIRQLVLNDPLTGLANRRACVKKLRKLVAKANATDGKQEPLCLAMADIDFFKKVNDTYGHSMGDEVLKEVSAIIRSHITDVGFASRWGGEEFLLVASIPKEQMITLLEETCEEIRQKDFVSDYQHFSITMTVGVAQYRSPDRMETTIDIADRRLYHGKQTGRNRIVAEME